MNIPELLKAMEEQNIRERDISNEEFAETLEQEFVMTNILQEYLTYLKAGKKTDCYSNKDFIEYLDGNKILIKKTEKFQMGSHNHSYPTYLHRHNYLEVDYVYRGRCNYYIGEEKKSFFLKEKELCIVNCNTIHAVQAVGREDIILKCFIPYGMVKDGGYQELSVNKERAEVFLQLKEEHSSYAVYVKADTVEKEVMEVFLFRMYEEFREKRIGWEMAVSNYLSLLVLELLRLEEEKLVLWLEKSKEMEDINVILECIKKNYPYVSLKALSKDFHYNENYLSRKIKHATGRNFTELLNRYRLTEAQRLLEDTELSIPEIAYRVGYLKPNYFYKMFKEKFGITPMEHRKRFHLFVKLT